MKRILLALGLLIFLHGCSDDSTVASDAPHEAPGRTITHLTLDNLDILPEVKEVDGVTYMDDILIVNEEYSLPPDYNPGLEQEVIDAYTEMAKDGAEQGLTFVIVSDFRSYQEQEALYEDYVAREGKEEADQYSALPGHSEHQSGLAFDIGSNISASTGDVDFEETPEFDWMKDVAHEYGFIIRYKEGKEDITGINYEPWHLRYVGVEAATEIYEKDLVLEEYLRLE